MSIVPPMEGWDEYQHLAYVEYLQNAGKVPVYGRDTVPEGLAREVVIMPLPSDAANQLNQNHARSYAQYWMDGPSTPPSNLEPVMLYQAQHPPLYYMLAGPIYRLAGGVVHLRNAVALLRLMNLISLVGATALLTQCLFRLAPDRPTFVWTSIAVSLSPMLLLNSVRVANDGIAVLVASAAMLSCTYMSKGRLLITPAVFAGILTGAGIWCKITNLALVPFTLACVWIPSEDRTALRRIVASGLSILLIGVIIWPFIGFSLAQYGVPFPSQEMIVNHAQGKELADYVSAASQINWWSKLPSWWGKGTLWVGGWSWIKAPGSLRMAYCVLIILGLLPYIASASLSKLRRRMHPQSKTATRTCLAMVVCYSACLVAHAISSQVAWGFVGTSPWYAAPAVPAFLFLVILGYRKWPYPALARMAVLLLIFSYPLTELIGSIVLMPWNYTRKAVELETMHRLAELQPKWLAMPTFLGALAAELVVLALVAKVALDTRWQQVKNQ